MSWVFFFPPDSHAEAITGQPCPGVDALSSQRSAGRGVHRLTSPRFPPFQEGLQLRAGSSHAETPPNNKSTAVRRALSYKETIRGTLDPGRHAVVESLAVNCFCFCNISTFLSVNPAPNLCRLPHSPVPLPVSISFWTNSNRTKSLCQASE